MLNAFISYAREDSARAEMLAQRLGQFHYQPWIDRELTGGQPWWDEVLDRIRRCEVFVAVLSRASLDSLACASERQYAIALGKPVLPVAVEPLTAAIPPELSRLEIVDYSIPGEDAAWSLARAAGTIPPCPPLPVPLPPSPPVPLSYISTLVQELDAPVLDHAAQRRVVDQLQIGARSLDQFERQGAVEAAKKLLSRGDQMLFADIKEATQRLLGEAAAPPQLPQSPPSIPLPAQRTTGKGCLRTLLAGVGVIALLLVIGLILLASCDTGGGGGGPCWVDPITGAVYCP
ncbi:MAG: toll/interleukin-1 receptor domain-containing protein [Kineosporiaceae bacterium]|nr:toll/interleukin-1 receptor domain-containing protein [Kineosporiaceae bacterium]